MYDRKATHESACHLCDLKIYPGDLISYEDYLWVHATCATPVLEKNTFRGYKENTWRRKTRRWEGR